MNYKKYLSTLLLVFVIVGYPIVTTLFLPDVKLYDGTESDLTVTRLVTVPYRAAILVIALMVIAMNWRRHIRMQLPIKLFFIFWLLLSIRIFYDLLIRTDIHIDPSVVQNQFLYAYLVCFLPTFALFRGNRNIDYELAFRLILIGCVLLIPLLAINSTSLFTAIGSDQRIFGNIAMNPITLGKIGVLMVLLALWWMRRSLSLRKVLVSSLLIVAGTFIILRSGSRGPLVSLIVGILFYVIARSRSPLWGISLSVIAVAILFFANSFLYETISKISPVMASRITLSGNVTQYEELSNGRSEEFAMAIDKFMNHPVVGDTYALIFPDGQLSYSHNIILDAFMGLGLLGGLLFVAILGYAFWNAYQIIRQQLSNSWVGMLCVFYIVSHMTSGCFYQADSLNALLVLVLSYL